MAYGDFKDLAKRTTSDEILRDKAFKTAGNRKYDGYQRGLASMFYKLFDKKIKGSGIEKKLNNQIKLQNQQLAEEYYKPIIRKFKKRRIFSSFKDNIRGADLADTQLIKKINKGVRFLLCFIDIYSKYAWVVSSKDKKDVTIVSSFQKY